jgi:hypothetical protein
MHLSKVTSQSYTSTELFVILSSGVSDFGNISEEPTSMHFFMGDDAKIGRVLEHVPYKVQSQETSFRQSLNALGPIAVEPEGWALVCRYFGKTPSSGSVLDEQDKCCGVCEVRGRGAKY